MRLLLIAHLISQKYFTGFGSQLADLGQVVDLSTLDGYENLISTRQMTDIMDNWRYNGKNYILPIYMNPVLFWWRGDLLKEQGFSEVPKTYDEVYALSEKYTIPDKRYAIQATSGRNWWDRWFDLLPSIMPKVMASLISPISKPAMITRPVVTFWTLCTHSFQKNGPFMILARMIH